MFQNSAVPETVKDCGAELQKPNKALKMFHPGGTFWGNL